MEALDVSGRSRERKGAYTVDRQRVEEVDPGAITSSRERARSSRVSQDGCSVIGNCAAVQVESVDNVKHSRTGEVDDLDFADSTMGGGNVGRRGNCDDVALCSRNCVRRRPGFSFKVGRVGLLEVTTAPLTTWSAVGNVNRRENGRREPCQELVTSLTSWLTLSSACELLGQDVVDVRVGRMGLPCPAPSRRQIGLRLRRRTSPHLLRR